MRPSMPASFLPASRTATPERFNGRRKKRGDGAVELAGYARGRSCGDRRSTTTSKQPHGWTRCGPRHGHRSGRRTPNQEVGADGIAAHIPVCFSKERSRTPPRKGRQRDGGSRTWAMSSDMGGVDDAFEIHLSAHPPVLSSTSNELGRTAVQIAGAEEPRFGGPWWRPEIC